MPSPNVACILRMEKWRLGEVQCLAVFTQLASDRAVNTSGIKAAQTLTKLV